MTITLIPVLDPPTTRLPPSGRIKLSSQEELLQCLQYLRLIYNPEVRGSRRVSKSSRTIASTSSSSSPASLDALRADAFERSHALRWLTSLLAHTTDEALLARAAALLAACAGTSGAGTVARTFAFGDVAVQLTDAPLDNGDFGTVGAQTWGSACVLAEMAVEAPAAFGLDAAAGRLRVLELGAGTGLVSLAVGKVLEGMGGLAAEVVASDFHPTALANLRSNIAANFSEDGTGALSMSAHFLDWSRPDSACKAPFDAPFDVVFGADVVYDIKHAEWIRDTLERVLRRPGDAETSSARFHMVISLRPSFEAESESVERVFSREWAGHGVDNWILGITHEEVITCEAESGGNGEVDYAYYVIEWLAV
ncbi:hypothetical protein FA95DRAFT_1564049 [Auriscalpium vulgare]|uniref:Uncharacterized protein n=1 Tax=Auriscalpium vulgare TaxID=40419 RepID=A0ACB8RFQ2_9AGAM|nr:hypothetical protein FA95DRAFT_1564049 [Auriscalpium vulgare]